MSRYLIFGGTGSLGKKLIERLAPTGHVSVYSRDEAKHWTIVNEFNHLTQPTNRRLDFYVGDIRDVKRIKDVIRQVRPKTIIIAAALKQVDTCELSPSESILTNLVGTQNVIDVINDVNPLCVSSVLFVSTDKACAPVNVYGMCKAMSERIVTSQVRTGIKHINYLAVRYGNVLESRGSIIPLFKYQAEHSEFLTVTDPNMTRFVMTLDDSVDLIVQTLSNGASGQTWIPRLPAMKIGDLAEIFAERSGKKIKIVGSRPGEKMHEDLINESESVRTHVSVSGEHYIIEPAFVTGSEKPFSYTSADTVMSKQQLQEHLSHLGVIDKPLNEFHGLNIEEIVTNRKD
jgi:FlaA1/EpsC-like NDP-sugar epimerase